MNFFTELKRRNVFKVASVYLLTTWLVLQIISVISPSLNLPAMFSTIVTVILFIGFPIACVIAWAFELTPDGIKFTNDVKEEASIRHETAQKLNASLMAAIVLLLGFILYDKFFSFQLDTSEQLSIAVLPFEDMSPDKSQEYFGDGIAEEILNSLAQIKSLNVIARTSSFSFKDSNKSVAEIAQRLGVNLILEGSIRKHGDKLRVTAQLIDTKNDYHLWSNTYDRQLDDVFIIQDELTKEITKALSIELLPEDQRKKYIPTTSTQAYEFYLQAKSHINKPNEESAEKTINLLTQALALDPDFYQAKALLYIAYRGARDYLGMTRTLYDQKRKEIFTDLVTINDEFAGKYIVFYEYLNIYMQNSKSAKRALKRALELNPSDSQSLLRLSEYQQKKDALISVDNALKNAPTDIPIKLESATLLMLAGKKQRVEELLNEVEELAPDSSAQLLMAYRYFYNVNRDAKGALQYIENINVNYSRRDIDLLLRLKLSTGDIDGALALMEESKGRFPYDENYAYKVANLLMVQQKNVWTGIQSQRLIKIASELPEDLLIIAHAYANLVTGNYKAVLSNEGLRLEVKSILLNLRGGIRFKEVFAYNFALADAYFGKMTLFNIADERWKHQNDWCEGFLFDTGCLAQLYYSGVEPNKKKLLNRLKQRSSLILSSNWRDKEYLATSPYYLFMHDLPEFKKFAEQYVVNNFKIED